MRPKDRHTLYRYQYFTLKQIIIMAFLRKYFKVSGTSILESVIALCIISCCLYIAILVYGNVFNERTSPAFYISRNRVSELYFLSQLRADSLRDALDPRYQIEEEVQNSHLKKIRVIATDSLNPTVEEFYIQNYE